MANKLTAILFTVYFTAPVIKLARKQTHSDRFRIQEAKFATDFIFTAASNVFNYLNETDVGLLLIIFDK